jgi:hypothetical protein
VLSGVAFVGDDKKDRAIDFMQRRPKTDFTMSKYNPLGRLHRDPDAIDYKSPGWMETSMPDSTGEGDDNGYSYRYYNLWLARTPIDPTGETWESPLCLLLPKHGGAQVRIVFPKSQHCLPIQVLTLFFYNHRSGGTTCVSLRTTTPRFPKPHKR